MKKLLKKVLGQKGMDLYYRSIARIGAFLYRHPSEKMIIIGVTGTKGKSTVGNMIWRILTEAGYTVGLTGTVAYRIGDQMELTKNKMTMSGRMQLQRWLRRMVNAKCDIAIVETTSEGIAQSRHRGIHYDVLVFTNLSPEHIESHGSFENYKQAKMELFRYLDTLPVKIIAGKPIQKAAIINMDDEHSNDFAEIGSYETPGVGTKKENDLTISDIHESLTGTDFFINGIPAHIPLLGAWNAHNALLAVGAAGAVGISLKKAIAALPFLEPIPGRMEFIDEGQPFTVIVDYAYEPLSLELLYTFCRTHMDPQKRIITLISSTGGGRDVRRRALNGEVAGRLCDVAIVTDEDPYDDDPQEIIDQVAEGVVRAGKVEGENMWKILDRTQAIERACTLAEPGDVVLLTAKGAEQKMCVAGGRKIDWDDRKIARLSLQKMQT